jgi:hypothetical protein
MSKDIALLHARARIGTGAALVLFPGPTGRLWIGEDATRRAVKVFTRALGVRDVAIGLGVAIALDRGAPVRGWIEAGAFSDAVDLVATLLAGGSIPDDTRNAAVVVAAGSAALGAVLARALDDPRARQPSEPNTVKL